MYYCVFRGRIKGVVITIEELEARIAGFDNPLFASFDSIEKAEEWLADMTKHENYISNIDVSRSKTMTHDNESLTQMLESASDVTDDLLTQVYEPKLIVSNNQNTESKTSICIHKTPENKIKTKTNICIHKTPENNIKNSTMFEVPNKKHKSNNYYPLNFKRVMSPNKLNFINMNSISVFPSNLIQNVPNRMSMFCDRMSMFFLPPTDHMWKSIDDDHSWKSIGDDRSWKSIDDDQSWKPNELRSDIDKSVSSESYCPFKSKPINTRQKTNYVNHKKWFEEEYRKTFEGKLTKEQECIVSVSVSGSNMFISGFKGVGKSFTANAIEFKLSSLDKNVIFTKSKYLQNELSNENFIKSQKWKDMDVLIIDDITLLEYHMFNYYDSQLKTFRNCNTKAFGGIQLIVVGDFCTQLYKCECSMSAGINRPAFLSQSWLNCDFLYLELHYNYKFYSQDRAFMEILNRIRLSNITLDDVQLLNKQYSIISSENNEIKRTVLFSTNKNIEELHEKELNRIEGKTSRFFSYDAKFVTHFSFNGIKWQRFYDCNAVKSLNLKAKAQVMAITQVNDNVNIGDRGIIRGFLSVSFKEVELHIKKQFFKLKVVRRETLDLKSLLETHVEIAAKHYSQCAAYPIVEFLNGKTVVVKPMLFILSTSPHGIEYRLQIPLILSWYTTVKVGIGMNLKHTYVAECSCHCPRNLFSALSLHTNLRYLKLERQLCVEDLNINQNEDNYAVRFHRMIRRFTLARAVVMSDLRRFPNTKALYDKIQNATPKQILKVDFHSQSFSALRLVCEQIIKFK